MGWGGHKLPTKNWFLYTRGGTNGVYLQKHSDDGRLLSEEVEIPAEMLRMLVAEDIRSRKISKLESATTDEILQDIMGG